MAPRVGGESRQPPRAGPLRSEAGASEAVLERPEMTSDAQGRSLVLAGGVKLAEASYEQLTALYQAQRERNEQLETRLLELQSAQGQLESYAADLQRTYAELRRHLSHMTVLQEVNRAISSALDPAEVVGRALDALADLIAYDAVSVYLLAQQGQVARRTAARGLVGAELGESVTLGDGILGQCLADGTVHMEATGSEDGAAPSLRLAVPLCAHGRTLGAMYLVRRDAEAFAEEELRVVELLGAGTGVAMQNALLYQETQRLATIDPLTDVPNYRYFHEALALEAERARRLSYPLGLLMVDLDRFKRINDVFGHPTGDEVLVTVAKAMHFELRRTDVIARIGGEEFAMILPGCDRNAVSAVGEKMRRTVAAIPPLAGPGKRRAEITLSVGGAAQGPSDVSPEALIRQADQALYSAKRSGRNRVRVWGVDARDAALSDVAASGRSVAHSGARARSTD